MLKRYPRTDAYARATVAEIFGADKLAAAQRFAATEFRSGVFLSQPDGTYRFEPLPRLAQIAPLQGIAAGDFDGDGHADIYAVQNSYAPIPAVGRFDGGLSQLLRGDGHGHFTPVPRRERADRSRRRQGPRRPGHRSGRLAGFPHHAKQRLDPGISKRRRGGPAFPARPAARTSRQSDRGRRAHHRGARRWRRADERGVARARGITASPRPHASSDTPMAIPCARSASAGHRAQSRKPPSLAEPQFYHCRRRGRDRPPGRGGAVQRARDRPNRSRFCRASCRAGSSSRTRSHCFRASSARPCRA